MEFFDRAIHRLVRQPIEHWLLDHPMANWFIAHPLMLMLAGFAVVLLLAGLLGAIAQLTENLWIGILRLPFQLGWTLMRGTVNVTKVIVQRSPTPALAELPEQKDGGRSPQQKLAELVSRLDAIQQEEAELIQQITTLVQQQFPSDSH
ncbi:MAG: hypothetical protein VKJ64_02045 [Leptolyngbyaceae bacterium]|nr:hypothetical protein [Leptolyngbyaceae bacterium]